MPKQTLLVYPNPFHALDHEGRPACVLPYEPEGNGVTTFDDRRFVGANLKSEILEKFPQGDARESRQRTWFDFTAEAVRVRNTAYYQHAIARGEIFAADEESAKLCGIQQTFMEPGLLLEQARKDAIGFWAQQAHDEHDAEAPKVLTEFSFGPMPEAVALRKKAEEDAKKDAEAEAKRSEEKAAAAKKAADDKAAAEKKAANKVPNAAGGE